MTLTFDDEDQNGVEFEHTILVGMPKKRIFEMLMDLKDTLNLKEEPQSEKEKTDHERKLINEMYLLISAILSNNMTGERITADWVGDQMTFDDMKLFLQQYVKFCKGEATSPN
jgi:hypothetical protein